MRKILVIRKFDNFSRILAANNFEIINLPLIETKAIDDLSEFETILESIENYDGVFLTSKQSAEIFRAKLKTDYRGKVYVLGRRSYEILKDANFNLHFDASANTAREMLENIAPDELKDKNFLFIRGDKSLRIVPKFLSKIASVDEAIVYETHNIAVEIDKINELREKLSLPQYVFSVRARRKVLSNSLARKFCIKLLLQRLEKRPPNFLKREI